MDVQHGTAAALQVATIFKITGSIEFVLATIWWVWTVLDTFKDSLRGPK